MNAKITKGTNVFLLESWDDKGTFSVELYSVLSWGAKRATLLNMDGTNRKHELRTAQVNATPSGTWVFPVAELADVEAKALELAAQFLEEKRAHYARCLAGPAEHGYQDPGYQRAIKADLAALHEPRVHIV